MLLDEWQASGDFSRSSRPAAGELDGSGDLLGSVLADVFHNTRGQVVRQSEANHRVPTREQIAFGAAAWTLRTPRRLGFAELVAMPAAGLLTLRFRIGRLFSLGLAVATVEPA